MNDLEKNAFGIFVIYQSEAKQPYHFNLVKIDNKEEDVIFTSENYTSKQSAEKGIESVKVNALDRDNFEIKQSEDQKYYFVLIAQNNEEIGMTKDFFIDILDCEKQINEVMKLAEDASVIDENELEDEKCK